MKSFLFRCAISKALEKPSPNIVPLSGQERLRLRDYSTTRFRTKPDNLVFIARSSNRNGITGIWFEGGCAEGVEVCFSFKQAAKMDLKIRQYYREQEIHYTNPFDFLWCQLTLKKYRSWFSNIVSQGFFNLKTLRRSERLQLLAQIAESSLRHTNYLTGEFSYLSERFGERSARHPDAQKERRYLKYMFESLVDTGDLEKVNHSYRITGRGFSTLAMAEQEDRKHRDSVKMSRILAVLTFGLLLTAIAQVWVNLP